VDEQHYGRKERGYHGKPQIPPLLSTGFPVESSVIDELHAPLQKKTKEGFSPLNHFPRDEVWVSGELPGKSRGRPTSRENERDMGHSGFVTEEEVKQFAFACSAVC
jgi:hypothetical protein